MPAIKLQGRVVRSWVKITGAVPGYFLGGGVRSPCTLPLDLPLNNPGLVQYLNSDLNA